MKENDFYKNILLSGKQLDIDIISLIDEIEIEENFEKMDTCKFKVMEEEDFSMQDLFSEGKKIEVTIGYFYGERKTFTGEIAGAKPRFPGDGLITIDIECTSQAKKGHENQKQKTYKGLRASDIVKQIAKSNGWETDIESTKEIIKHINQTGQTDIEFIMKLAKKENFYFKITGNKIIFKKRDIPASISYVFDYRKNSRNVESFDPKFDTNKKGKGIKASNINKDTGDIVSTTKLDKEKKMGKHSAQKVTKTVSEKEFRERYSKRK